jgi:L-alanine-DL-glutamate epimerase-like enolase superfamily enzyme
MSSNVLGLEVAIEEFPLKEPFRITGHTMVTAEVVTVTLTRGGLFGRGEASGVYYRDGEDIPGIVKQIEAVRRQIESGISRTSLQELLPAGGARNAIDCALWDLEAKQAHTPAWRIAGLKEPRPLLTTFTCAANDPDKMAATARGYTQAKAIKLKLTGEAIDADRVRAVRAARPDVWLSVDANQGFTPESLERLMPVLVDAQVKLIEQPFKIGQDELLKEVDTSIPLASDESVQSLADLPDQVGRVDVVNIKLDKCGGLTEGLAMAREARRLGLDVMVGNMNGTSLAMAPSFLVGQLCQIVDLDGPIFLSNDRTPSVQYEEGMITCPGSLWGGAEALR